MNNVKKITKKELKKIEQKELFHIAEVENKTIVSKKLNIKNFLKNLSLENIERIKKEIVSNNYKNKKIFKLSKISAFDIFVIKNNTKKVYYYIDKNNNYFLFDIKE